MPDGCVIRNYWREYNETQTPKKDNTTAGITFDIREDYIELLKEAGYNTNEEVILAGEEAILDIEGIGPSTVKRIFSFNVEG